MKKGLVFRSTGKLYDVLIDGQLISCSLRGKIRLAGIRTTNPIAAGDWVMVEHNSENNTGSIVSIEDRSNYIIRKSVNLSKEAQIIAANISRAFLVTTLTYPETSPGFIDRFLVTAEAYRIPVTLIFHKMDQYENREIVEEFASIYKNIGYDILYTSIHTTEGLEELKLKTQEGVFLFSGQSGAGKSSLIRTVSHNENIRIGEVSDWSGKGQHTTTFAELFQLNEKAFLVDTPGIKGFGLVDIPKEEVGHYFPEFFKLLHTCKFSNCMHLNEPGCAVIHAVENNELAESRYLSYCSILEDNSEKYRKQ
ncbi:MAG: ribosome small subunit-dependent GTPase A [Bacteroidota bacterium]